MALSTKNVLFDAEKDLLIRLGFDLPVHLCEQGMIPIRAVYDGTAQDLFMQNAKGADVDKFRKIYQALTDASVIRGTEEFDKLFI